MVAGHWTILGQVFDPLSGETYNIFTRWISDFAAKQPEGIWIKAGMGTFCLALVEFFRRLARVEAADMRGVWRGFAVLIMATMMIGGLMLVALFDLSPRQYRLIESRVILEQARGGEPPEIDAEPEESSWFEVLLEPKGSTLREGLLRDSPLPELELKPLRERIVRESWGQEELLDYLQDKMREQAEIEAAKAAIPSDDEVDVVRELRALPKAPRELSKHWYHRLGFQLFLLGFACSSLWVARAEWREKAYRRLPGTLLMLTLTFVFGVWLLAEKVGLAGVPQRALLILIGIWVIRNFRYACLRPESSTPGHESVPRLTHRQDCEVPTLPG
jgi:hypothetical protein